MQRLRNFGECLQMALRVLYGNAMLLGLLLVVEALAAQGLVAAEAADPSPTPWPEQFHAQIHQNTSGKLSTIELWYDWPNGRNLNIIQEQLGVLLYDLEWTNGTSYYYDLAAESCFSIKFPVGILRPDWLVDNSHYLGVREVDGFSCHVWEKADFITYYEDVASKRPVHWLFFNGMSQHVITFEEGKVLEDKHWQAPSYCFDDTAEREPTEQSVLSSGLHSSLQPWTRHSSNLAMSSPR